MACLINTDKNPSPSWLAEQLQSVTGTAAACPWLVPAPRLPVSGWVAVDVPRLCPKLLLPAAFTAAKLSPEEPPFSLDADVTRLLCPVFHRGWRGRRRESCLKCWVVPLLHLQNPDRIKGQEFKRHQQYTASCGLGTLSTCCRVQPVSLEVIYINNAGKRRAQTLTLGLFHRVLVNR